MLLEITVKEKQKEESQISLNYLDGKDNNFILFKFSFLEINFSALYFKLMRKINKEASCDK